MTTQLPPDYETRHTLALALCDHLGINPEHVRLGSMQIELGPDHHRITWTGHAHLNLNDLTRLLLQAHGHTHGHSPTAVPCINAPLCNREAGHDGQCTLAP